MQKSCVVFNNAYTFFTRPVRVHIFTLFLHSICAHIMGYRTECGSLKLKAAINSNKKWQKHQSYLTAFYCLLKINSSRRNYTRTFKSGNVMCDLEFVTHSHV